MNVYAYRFQPTRLEILTQGPTAEEVPVIAEHWSHLTALADRGVLVLAGRTRVTDARAFAIVVFRAESDDAARAVMEGDPAVRAGVMRAELFPFEVLLAEAASAGR